MKNILSMEDFLQKQYESIQETLTNSEGNLTELNEGLLTNLFGALLKKDMWSLIKGEEAIKKEFREIDNKLNGFYLTKVKNPNASQNVRQILVDWAGDIYNAKMKAKEESEKNNEDDKDKQISLEDTLSMFSGDSEEKIKKGGVTDETLKSFSKLYKDGLDMKSRIKVKPELEKMLKEVEKVDKKYQKLLDDATGSSSDLKRWANLLKMGMENIIDKLLCGKYDEENKLAKDLEEVQKKDNESMKKKNEEEIKKENEQLKEIDNNRKELFKKCNIQITRTKTAKDFLTNFVKVAGDEKLYESFEIENLKGKTKIKEDAIDFFEKNLGIKLKDKDDKERGCVYAAIFCFNRDVLPDIDNNSKFSSFDKMTGESMHAFTTAFCNILFYAANEANSNGNKISNEMKNFIAHCAMSSNVDLGFGLPFTKDTENLPEPKEGEEDKRVGMLNYFLNKTKEILNKSNEGKPIANGIDTIVKEVVEIAKKLVSENNKKKEQEAKEEQKKEEQENNKE